MDHYCSIIGVVARAFFEVRSNDEFVDFVSRSVNSSASELRKRIDGSGDLGLPDDCTEYLYRINDDQKGVIDIDAAFMRTELINARMQVFLKGLDSEVRASRGFQDYVTPSMSAMFGPPIRDEGHYVVFHKHGLVLVTRIVPGTGSLSTHITREDHIDLDGLELFYEAFIPNNEPFIGNSSSEIRVHILDPLGGVDLTEADDPDTLMELMFAGMNNRYRVENWVIGREITAEQAEEWRDNDGDLYIIVRYKEGKPMKHQVTKAVWDNARSIL